MLWTSIRLLAFTNEGPLPIFLARKPCTVSKSTVESEKVNEESEISNVNKSQIKVAGTVQGREVNENNIGEIVSKIIDRSESEGKGKTTIKIEIEICHE